MSKVTDEQLEALAPYLAVRLPIASDVREVDMYCPLHDDGNRSATIDLRRGLWRCHAQCGGGSVRQLLDGAEDYFVPMEGRALNGSRSSRPKKTGRKERASVGSVEAWHGTLMDRADLKEDLWLARGISIETIGRYRLGYDKKRKAFTIPVYGAARKLHTVRFYDLAPSPGRRKMWGLRGRNEPRLYPYAAATALRPGSTAIVCEGEWDALIARQNGFNAITRTNGAKAWKDEWAAHFSGCIVYLCHDCDVEGEEADARVYASLRGIAEEVRLVELPYATAPKHGKDLTDFFLDNEEFGTSEFSALLDDAPLYDPDRHQPEEIVAAGSVLDAFDSSKRGEPLRITVTIKGKRGPGYTVPKTIEYRCSQDLGAKCEACPMKKKHSGEWDREIDPGDPLVLKFLDASEKMHRDALVETAGIPNGRCSKLMLAVADSQAVEVLFGRPYVDEVQSEDAADYVDLKILSCGRHDTPSNTSIQATGALHPNPRHAGNEFLVWEIAPMETSLDKFILDGKAIQEMRKFRPGEGERPLAKFYKIVRSLSRNVTRIYHRDELHALVDLVYHSALSFDFDGERIEHGWLDALVVGDTRTGKSRVAEKLARHYAAGEIISCETASFAGVVGGLHQPTGGKEWAITWGAIPINDRRLVVLDEAGGLSEKEIAEMSSVRSSGRAELHKIRTERTVARTRLIWLANPRHGRMSHYTYGVEAIEGLIGKDEDIARFDLAMTVADEEVSPVDLRSPPAEKTLYSSEACAALVRWVWSRKPEQIVWGKGAEATAIRLSEEMGQRYVPEPPLVQTANIREKIARIAVALAGRTFSTDESYETIIVREEHVEDAVKLLDRIYSMRGFGYAERSAQRLRDRLVAADSAPAVEIWLEEIPGLPNYLRTAGRGFRRQDLEEILNVTKEEANGIINYLYEARMIRKDRSAIYVEPELHRVLKEVRGV